MNLSILIQRLYKKTNTQIPRKHIELIVKKMYETMREQLLSGKSFNITHLGSLIAINRKQRIGIDPSTGNKMTIKARKAIKFRISAALKKDLNT